MAQYIVIKKKNKVLSLEAIKCNLKRAKLIASHPFDKYAKYLSKDTIKKYLKQINILKNELNLYEYKKDILSSRRR